MIDQKPVQLDPAKCKLIACATVIEEMLPVLPSGMASEVMQFGLHSDPEKLNKALQLAIDTSGPDVETILLGYGLCSKSVVGLKSESRTIIVPKVDDCIAIFMGSAAEYSRQHQKNPGTLYMTKGWIEAGGAQGKGHAEMVKRYGEARARSLTKLMFKNYNRLVFIDTGNYNLEHYRIRSKTMAENLDLQYEEIKGSNSIITRMLFGPRDDNFVIVPPGRAISFLDFKNS